MQEHEKPISVTKIGEFKDKLEDVGLSVTDSIYVSVSGFGRDARRRAKDHNIRLFQLEGLTPDRLSSAIHQAFQSNVYLLPTIEEVLFVSAIPPRNMWNVMFITDAWGNIQGGLFELIWKKWMNDEIPVALGTYRMDITPPDGWDWHIPQPLLHRSITVTIRMLGLVITAKGEAHRHLLRDILNEQYERAHIRTIFTENPGAISVTVVENEEELKAATQLGGAASIVFETEKAPRIQVLRKDYWPLTDRAVSAIQKRFNDSMVVGIVDDAFAQDLSFEELEGTDVGSIWGKTGADILLQEARIGR